MRHLNRHTKSIRTSLSILSLTLFVYAFTVWDATAADKHRKMVNCDAHSGGCTRRLNELDVILEISPRPVKAMQNLQFNLTLSGRDLALSAAPYIDLSMPDMNMGPNRVLLKSVGQGRYAGQGIIVRCPSGKRIWQAAVTVPDLGTVKFIFDVIY